MIITAVFWTPMQRLECLAVWYFNVSLLSRTGSAIKTAVRQVTPPLLQSKWINRVELGGLQPAVL